MSHSTEVSIFIFFSFIFPLMLIGALIDALDTKFRRYFDLLYKLLNVYLVLMVVVVACLMFFVSGETSDSRLDLIGQLPFVTMAWMLTIIAAKSARKLHIKNSGSS